MSNSELISVVIPVYNSELTIKQAIQSIVDQTYTNIEIIIVNDGSEGATAEIVKGMLYDINYTEQDNAGAAAARNKGVNFAEGNYIVFWDANDIWHKQKLALQMKAFVLNTGLAFCSIFGCIVKS